MNLKQSPTRGLRCLFGMAGLALLIGCAEWQSPVSDEVKRPAATLPQPESSVPVGAANTAETFDTTTKEQRVAAQRKTSSGGILGRTVVSLGSPADPGFWLKTPLVTAEQQGQVTDPASGKSVAVTLIPIEGPASAGSRISLAAMRLLELPLTSLAEIEVRGAN